MLEKELGPEKAMATFWWLCRGLYMTRVSDGFQLPLEREKSSLRMLRKKPMRPVRQQAPRTNRPISPKSGTRRVTESIEFAGPSFARGRFHLSCIKKTGSRFRTTRSPSRASA